MSLIKTRPHYRPPHTRLQAAALSFPSKNTEKQVAFLEEHPDTGACFTWGEVIDENQTIVSKKNCLIYQAMNAAHTFELLSKKPVSLCCLFSARM